ncbi:hypothetical protein BU24DRAFT_454237 [Aaosphaeria arxii CBS 175.79]|uniref:Centromere protein Cenp-K n=1 Tax=Aaosphaeria arxii CBS 175.79 TaxID=1450172 RepID=A0A6A5XET3_9PLEO|nr:uncharacterized protein BU24DRAFT_454237 [Aaosphaeria arxii CBS 175.79]KAF2011745.1 hypothetical protein BU24DRAFT_454237 [Aaosphaeria arxii CBS 175.79]
MEQIHELTLTNIRRYAVDAREMQGELMDVDASHTKTRLEQTIKELQGRVSEQQAALEKLRLAVQGDVQRTAYAAIDPRERLKQLLAVKQAYTQFQPVAPFLPSRDSELPSLLAARAIQQTVKETKDAIASTEARLSRTESTLQKENANLRDAHLLAQALEGRLERLRAQSQDRSQKTPAQLAKDLIAAKREQKEIYDGEFARLGEAFHEFVTEILSPMLAAEELGGPVVGDLPEVEDDMLAVGFTKKGKVKSTKKAPSDTLRQRRIDQIWGDKAMDEGEQLGEAEAADNDMRKLIESLFATLTGPGGGKAYCDLERDSAASRFLVRAKIAQYHPRDARKLRLIDFGRELDD